MNPTAVIRKVTLDKARTLHFDLNTYAAFEKATGKFFMEFLLSLQVARDEALAAFPVKLVGKGENETDANQARRNLETLSKCSLSDIRALLWASCHSYQKRGGETVAVWPLSIEEIAQYVTLQTGMGLIGLLLSACTEAMPQAGDSVVDMSEIDEPRPMRQGASTPDDGGSESGEPDGALLAFLTPTSVGSPLED